MQARRRRADDYRACGALDAFRAVRSTRTLDRMHAVLGPWKGTERFLGFSCVRCGFRSRDVSCRSERLKLLVRCPSCSSVYLVSGSLLLGLGLAGLFSIFLALALSILLPKVAAGVVAPWAIIVVAALVGLPLTLLAKPALARWLISYQYFGHAI